MATEKPRLILIGGFLGSGKTTLMTAIGERLAVKGFKVAVVTNDQGEFLVDTAYVREKGLVAGEILGGCFCCNFGELIEILKNLSAGNTPDYILAEPVGSCTDLAATVLGPISLYHDNLVDLGPYIVLADGSRLAGEYQTLNLESPVSPREVLVSHQIREASRIVLSKTDLLTEEEQDAAVARLLELNPPAKILPCSARTETGLENLEAWVTDPNPGELPRIVDIDYPTYAAAEAELGWYNGICSFVSETPFSPDDLAMDMILSIKAQLGLDAAHAKLLLTTEAGLIKAGLAGGRIQADSVFKPGSTVNRAGLVLNLRALRSPEELEKLGEKVISDAAADTGTEWKDYEFEALIPGEPKPTHRLS